MSCAVGSGVAAEKDLAEQPADGARARLARGEGAPPAAAQMLHRSVDLGGRAGAVDSFEDDEQRAGGAAGLAWGDLAHAVEFD